LTDFLSLQLSVPHGARLSDIREQLRGQRLTSFSNPVTNSPFSDLPPVKPSAIAIGTAFNHLASLAILGPVFGDTYRQAQAANSKEEFFKSKETASAAAAWGTSLAGSALQSYGVGALLNATGTLSYKGAAYLGGLIFAASSAPSVSFAYLMYLKLEHVLTTIPVHCPDLHREAPS
jgi:hypothetical protein